MKHWRRIVGGFGLLFYFCIFGNLVGCEKVKEPSVITPSAGPGSGDNLPE